jgi:Chaperone of endosialidase
MSAIFGGSKSKSSNSNKGIINSAFQPLLGQAVNSNNQLSQFLGGDASQFSKFAEAAGMPFEASRGIDQIGSAAAGRGVFRSGARDKGIEEFRRGLSGRYAQQFIQSLLGQTQSSLGAGGLVSGAGQESKSSSKPGIASFIGQAASAAAASDERLKMDITPVGINADGLTVYQYRYKGNAAVFTGVMAQEVAEKRPDALGPINNGYMSVDYSKINIIDRV